MTAFQPWRVVETHHDEMDRPVRTIHRTAIGTTPMAEHTARQLATQERARYAGANRRRTYRAEPVPAAWSDPNEELTS